MLMVNLTGWLRLHGMNWHELNEINEVLSSALVCKHYVDAKLSLVN